LNNGAYRAIQLTTNMVAVMMTSASIKTP